MEFSHSMPSLSLFLFNTYSGYATLVLQDKKKTEFLLSKKGVGQGYPLSMLAAVMPLIKSLSNPSNWIQNWFADDSSCIAKLTHLRDWFDKLCEHGPKYGYYPEVILEVDKCIVIVDSNHETDARSAFEHLGVKVVKGYRLLGGFIGNHDSTKAFMQNKIMELTNSVFKLSKVAESQPQAAFSALEKSLQFEWSYIQRILPNFDDEYVPIQDAVSHSLGACGSGKPMLSHTLLEKCMH